MDIFEYNINYVQAGAGELKDYLLSKELFWPLQVQTTAGQVPYPKLTIGNLLFYMRRAKATILEDSQKSQYDQLEHTVKKIHSDWQVAWEEKAKKEYQSRLRQWRIYLGDLNKEESSSAFHYKTKVKIRIFLELLSESVPVIQDKELESLDTVLRAHFIAGDFMWELFNSSEFPQEKFWYMYGYVK
ncbi:MAG: hypothetical protein HON98_01360 [Chloroflexi bacterium]|jgi:hypothetical protein|nr:hypothetical protein [Chloroflexota bacterium]MBT3668818.1 hypothetical protein [Chloroflexota bacterium]MBT4003801.1 hypothetical protein [Chloroflexota bacterium]MBT4306532.1 hypothetical protein [Chloroflexota bacterium]MBT4533916.1 hypothetical protein [Chloroflexota bacterium]